MKYYVYVFLDPRKPGKYTYEDLIFNFEPYYVGRGFGKRCSSHFKPSVLSAEKHTIKVKKIQKIINEGYDPKKYILKVYTNISYTDSIEKEQKLILLIGKIIDKTGPLSNYADGQSDVFHLSSKMKGKTYEELYGDEKAKQLKLQKKERFTGKNNPRFGKPGTFKGKKHSNEAKQKISIQNGKRIVQIDIKTGKIINTFNSIREGAKFLNILTSSINNCLSPNNRSKSAGGFYWKYVE